MRIHVFCAAVHPKSFVLNGKDINTTLLLTQHVSDLLFMYLTKMASHILIRPKRGVVQC